MAGIDRRTGWGAGLHGSAVWLGPVTFSLGVAYLWKYRYAREFMPSDHGTYLVGPLLWAIAAAIAYLAWRQAPRGEHERNLVGLALVVGLFGVAVSVLVGIYAGTGLSPYGHTPRWLVTNLVYAGAPLVAVEFARAYVLRLFGHWPTIAVAATAAVGASLAYSYQQVLSWQGSESAAQFYAARLLPEVSSNILASFLALIGGPLASIAYRGTYLMYEWYSPYLANPPWLTAAFVGVATPAIGLWVVEGLTSGPDEADPSGASKPRGGLSTAWVMTAIASLALVWFSMGFFGVKPSFVPTHSMAPSIQPGSIAITRNINPDHVRVGDVVLYRRGRHAVLHRVIARWPNGTFTTQGDANNTPDPEAVFPAQIEGRLLFDVPYVGWIPIWTSRVLNAALGR